MTYRLEIVHREGVDSLTAEAAEPCGGCFNYYFCSEGGTVTSEVEARAYNILFRKATTESDRFRQWFYPNMGDRDYTINPSVFRLIRAKALEGKSAEEIAGAIFEEHL